MFALGPLESLQLVVGPGLCAAPPKAFPFTLPEIWMLVISFPYAFCATTANGPVGSDEYARCAWF